MYKLFPTKTAHSMRINTFRFLLIGLILLGSIDLNAQDAMEKERIIVLTDIENEPDDAMSLIRFLTYSNQWDVEGLIATTSRHQRDQIAAWRIREILTAYNKVRNNLEKHEKGYPTTDHLLSILKEGIPKYGMEAVGEGMDSEGSELIIQSVDAEDSRPIWCGEGPIAWLRLFGKLIKPAPPQKWTSLSRN